MLNKFKDILSFSTYLPPLVFFKSSIRTPMDRVKLHTSPLPLKVQCGEGLASSNRSFNVAFFRHLFYQVSPSNILWFSGFSVGVWSPAIDVDTALRTFDLYLRFQENLFNNVFDGYNYLQSQGFQAALEITRNQIDSFDIIFPKWGYTNAFILFTLFLPGVGAVFVLIFGRFLNAKSLLLLNLIITLSIAINSTYWVNWGSTLLIKPLFFISTKVAAPVDNCRNWVAPFYNWEITYDLLSASMCSLVTIVGLLVHFYSYNYLLKDPHLIRFMGYLNLFIFFMLFLVCSDNLTQFFFAWEGVGICSYLLVGFWSTRLQASKAALKAVLVNKVGDVGLLFAIAYSWNLFNVSTFSQYDKIFSQLSTGFLLDNFDYNNALLGYGLTLICFGYLLAAVAKSAQIGLHTWLPDAMEGPTPVSALIHAATMVTAGIFLLLRISSILTLLYYISFVILILGSCTAVMSGFIASYQTDLKKIIAYSTCSQLGYMFFSCGLTVYSASLFHLLSHGFFKALLFLVAGSVIHLHLNEQSVGKMPVFENIKITNLLTISMYIGFVSLTALPFFSGFYSKEPILQIGASSFYLNAWMSGTVGYNFGLFAAVLTALYSASAFEEILSINPKKMRSNLLHKTLPFSTKLSLISLIIFSIGFGFFYQKSLTLLFQSYFKAQTSFNVSLLNWTKDPVLLDFSLISQSLPLLFDILPLIFCLLLTGIPRMQLLRFYRKNRIFYSLFYGLDSLNFKDQMLKKVLSLFKSWGLNKLWFDYLYNNINFSVLRIGYFSLLKSLDKGLFEYFGPTSAVIFLKKVNYYLKLTTYKISLEGLYLVSLFIALNYLMFL